MSSVLKFKDNETGIWKEIQTLVGPQGEPGANGQDGKDYILTDADKQEIAALSGGGGGKLLHFLGQGPTDETRALINNYFKQYKETGIWPSDILICNTNYNSNTYTVLTDIQMGENWFQAYSPLPSTPSYTGVLNCYEWNGNEFNTIYYSFSWYDPNESSGGDWTWNGDNWGSSNIYLPDQCKELKLSYVSQYNGSYTMTVHITPSNGNYFHEEMESYYSAVYPNYSDDQPRVHHFYYDSTNWLGVNIDDYTFLGYHYK